MKLRHESVGMNDGKWLYVDSLATDGRNNTTGASSLNQTLVLNDGRTLSYQCLGDPNGIPLFFFHGTPGSRFCVSNTDPIANIAGLQLILPDRPGYGLSSEQPNRSFVSWSSDVAELANALNLDDYSVSGSSGGGPYALACGIQQPNRVKRILLFNTASPLDNRDASKGMSIGNRIGIWTAKYSPWLLKILIRVSANSMHKNPDANLDSLTKQLCEADAQWMKNSEFREAVLRDMKEAYSNGIAGHFVDALLLHKDWQMDLRKIQQPVDLWHGEDDTLVPIQNARRLAQQIPGCVSKFIPNAGHFLIDLPEVISDLEAVVREW